MIPSAWHLSIEKGLGPRRVAQCRRGRSKLQGWAVRGGVSGAAGTREWLRWLPFNISGCRRARTQAISKGGGARWLVYASDCLITRPKFIVIGKGSHIENAPRE